MLVIILLTIHYGIAIGLFHIGRAIAIGIMLIVGWAWYVSFCFLSFCNLQFISYITTYRDLFVSFFLRSFLLLLSCFISKRKIGSFCKNKTNESSSVRNMEQWKQKNEGSVIILQFHFDTKPFSRCSFPSNLFPTGSDSQEHNEITLIIIF